MKAGGGLLAGVRGRQARARADGTVGGMVTRWAAAVRDAFEAEAAQRRLFLWLPVGIGSGIALYFSADREPSLAATDIATALMIAGAVALRSHRRAFLCLIAASSVFGGMALAGWRTAHLSAPVLDRIRITSLQGYIEEMDFRRNGARFILRVYASDVLPADRLPVRVRLSTRRTPPFEAGTFVDVKARLLPPSRAAAPGAYDFARDAFFAQIGAVGTVLGTMEEAVAPEPPDWSLALTAAIDRARNALARRVDAIVGGDAGAIAAAMVTGKRDLLSADAKDIIRQAGIFHVITISGVQMTLVAAIFFVGLRRLLALSRTLALHYPIKKWAAGAAILGAIGYAAMTGSRIGTQRALAMTVIMLFAVLIDRRALTMRNLALAALAVLVTEPEALLGASFQLSFAAVAALVALYEARARAMAGGTDEASGIRIEAPPTRRFGLFGRRRAGHGVGAALVATASATAATASFMATNFHEVNPYVLIGNPLTLTLIELFAVPGALIGTALYPLGLDGFVWHWLGFGIGLIMAAARFIGALPGSTIHLPAFAPWALVFFALAVLSAVLWHTRLLRLTAVPFALVGLAGAAAGPTFDIAVADGGDAVAVRGADGRLVVIGQRPSGFDAEQWLRSDADGRDGKAAVERRTCDKLGCTAVLRDGRNVALVADLDGFAEDCLRATVLVTPLYAPAGCAAPVVIDRGTLRATGAVTLRATGNGFIKQTARGSDEDRPWSPAPPPFRPWASRHDTAAVTGSSIPAHDAANAQLVGPDDAP